MLYWRPELLLTISTSLYYVLNKHSGRHCSAFKDFIVEKSHEEKAKANTVWQINTLFYFCYRISHALFFCFVFICLFCRHFCFILVWTLVLFWFCFFTKGISDSMQGWERVMKAYCFYLCKYQKKLSGNKRRGRNWE